MTPCHTMLYNAIPCYDTLCHLELGYILSYHGKRQTHRPCCWHVMDTCWTCSGNILNLFCTCVEHSLDVCWACIGHALHLFWMCITHILDIIPAYIDHASNTFRTCIVHVVYTCWTYFDMLRECAGPVSGFHIILTVYSWVPLDP